MNVPLFSIQVCVQPRPLAGNMALPAFAAERRAAAPCYRSPSVSKLLLRCCNGTDGRTDRETDGHRTELYRPPSNGGSRHCFLAARLISDSLTPVLVLRDTVVGFIFFLLLSALEVILTPRHYNNIRS